MPTQYSTAGYGGLADFDAVSEFAMEIRNVQAAKGKPAPGLAPPVAHPGSSNFAVPRKLNVPKARRPSCADNCSDTTVPDESECESLSSLSQSSNCHPITRTVPTRSKQAKGNGCGNRNMPGPRVYARAPTHDGERASHPAVLDSSPIDFAIAWSRAFEKPEKPKGTKQGDPRNHAEPAAMATNARQWRASDGPDMFGVPHNIRNTMAGMLREPPQRQQCSAMRGGYPAPPGTSCNAMPWGQPTRETGAASSGTPNAPHYEKQAFHSPAHRPITIVQDSYPDMPCKVYLPHYECDMPELDKKLPVKKRVPEWQSSEVFRL